MATVKLSELSEEKTNEILARIIKKMLQTAQVREEGGIIVIPIDFTQLYTTLIEFEIVTPVMQVFVVDPIPPGFTFEWTVNTPPNYYYLFVENVVSIFPDRVLEVAIYIDDKLLHYDPDVVQDRYAQPLNFPRRFGAIKAVRRNWKIIIRNKSEDKVAYWSAWASYGIIHQDYYDTIYREFFRILASAFKLPVQVSY
jgi:hypothetical protein